jgi:hypothetical protein
MCKSICEGEDGNGIAEGFSLHRDQRRCGGRRDPVADTEDSHKTMEIRVLRSSRLLWYAPI